MPPAMQTVGSDWIRHPAIEKQLTHRQWPGLFAVCAPPSFSCDGGASCVCAGKLGSHGHPCTADLLVVPAE